MSWPCGNSLANFCTSEGFKNQSPFDLNEANGEAFIIAELQKLAREFSHGLDLKL